MKVQNHHYGIPFHKYYFSNPRHFRWLDLLLPTAYMDCYTSEKPRLFNTEYRHTLLTDLTPDEASIFQNFPKDTRNQIRRCEQEQRFTLNLNSPLEQFIPLYNAFAQVRGLSLFMEADATSMGDNSQTGSSYEIPESYPAYRHPNKRWRVKTGAMPNWYKARTGTRTRALSGAARVARYRPQKFD